MNNMIIVLLPFTGDISQQVSGEIEKVFEVMTGSKSSKVILCINKCGLHLEELRAELADKEDPIGFMKEKYIFVGQTVKFVGVR